MIEREVEKKIGKYLVGSSHKILFVWGPRRSGKTTLLQKIGKEKGVKVFDFGLISDQEKFLPDITVLQKIVKVGNLILIDEVQNYPEATAVLKVLFDHFKVKIIATGSSELRQKTADFDSLAGRFEEVYCLPLSVSEVARQKNVLSYEEVASSLEIAQEGQIYGFYPEVYLEQDTNKKIEILQNLVDTYVLKDIVSIYELRNTKLAKEILLKIALQLGSEVSVREIANSLQTSPQTVANYLEIFVKNYILICLPSFKTNARRAISEHKKYFFYDLGIRNVLVSDFRSLDIRPDRGGVFENFIVSEIEKQRRNQAVKINVYFYREYSGKEVDIVLEDYQKKYVCLEVKTGKVKVVAPNFPLPHKLEVVRPDNYFKILSLL